MLTLGPAAQLDHFPDAGKMVIASVTGGFASVFRLGYDGQEIVPLGITKEGLKVPCEPKLVAVVIELRNRLKGRMIAAFWHLA